MEKKRPQSKVKAEAKHTKGKNLALVFLGFGFLVLGAVGIALPVLPTTPLVLLAAACFSLGSPRLLSWLLQNRILGPNIENYRSGQGVSRARKIFAILFLWAGLVVSMLVVRSTTVHIILSIVGLCVTVHLLMIKTKT